MNSVKKNFMYNTAYQILILIIPLVTAPYLSRVIGAEGIGIYSYTYSIAYYFGLFILLGLNNYGNRKIAQVKDNKEKLSKEFLSIYLMQVMMSIIVIGIYGIYITLNNYTYKIIQVIQIVYLISVALDINWLFFGLEKFKITVTRNFLIKILTFICIFIFVKNEQDLWVYTLIMSLSYLISQCCLFPFLKKIIQPVKVTFKDVIKHIKPNLILFIPAISVSVYKVMDKIMLGSMTNMTTVGFYENAEKIINIPTTIITALGTVMLPRVSNLVSNGKEEEAKRYTDISMKFMMFLAIPFTLGIMAVIENLAPIYFGEDFALTGTFAKYLSLTLPFVSWANVIRTQYLLPKEKDKLYIVSIISGAVINLVFNLILIKQYQGMGAIISTIMAEFTVMIIQTVYVINKMNIKQYFKETVFFLIKGLIMYFLVISLESWIENIIILIILQVIYGVLIYTILNYKYIYSLIKDFNPIKLDKRKVVKE